MVFAIVQQSTSHGLIKLIEYIKCMLTRKTTFVELKKAFESTLDSLFFLFIYSTYLKL